MKIIKFLDEYHSRYSSNIFAFSGYFAFLLVLFAYIYPSMLTVFTLLYYPIKYEIIFFCWTAFVLFGVSLSAIVFIFEKILEFRINNTFWVQNKIIKNIRICGGILSALGTICFVGFLFLLTVIQYF